MARINITCTEKEMDNILETFEDNCPFYPPVKECGEDTRCADCLTDNIHFDIIEMEEE
jgi:hypothetical protein